LIDNLPKIDVGMAGLKNIDYVLRKLAWTRSQRIWPNGLRRAGPRCYLENEGRSERPYRGYGFGALDAFDGYVSYRLLDE